MANAMQLLPKLGPDEKNALRSFLQRGEVRLSTMHRVATAFLSGAGLLFLFPILLRDGVPQLLHFWSEGALSTTGARHFLAQAYWLLGLPLAAIAFVPLLALYLLLRDIIQFYYTGHAPDYKFDEFIPRFSLTGIAFSADESEQAKVYICNHQYGTDIKKFVIPFDQDKVAYYDRLAKSYVPEPGAPSIPPSVVPPTRRRQTDNSLFVHLKDKIEPYDKIIVDRDNQHLHVAMGLAGFFDRSLVEEVAKLEISLIRHSLALRRLVLRYVKALLAFIWTALIVSTATSILMEWTPQEDVVDLRILAGVLLVWSLLMPFVVRAPIRWIRELASGDPPRADYTRDEELVNFERLVVYVCLIASFACLAALILSSIRST